MKIEYIKYKNFFSVGNNPVEIDFTTLPNLVLINGINKDIENDEAYHDEKPHSNSSGKSTLSEAIIYCLYGEFLRKGLNHADAINNITRGDLEVELIFELNNTYYRIIRRRKPNELLLWESKDKVWNKDSELTKGGIPATQLEINKKLGLNYKAFVNVAFFGQHNDISFLDCDAKDRREIAESLLSLDIFKVCAENTKEIIKDIKRDLKELSNKYVHLREEESAADKRLYNITSQHQFWINNKETVINNCKNEIANLTKSIMMSNNDAQIKILELEEVIQATHAKKQEVLNSFNECKNKTNELNIKLHQGEMASVSLKTEIYNLEQDLKKNTTEMNEIQSLKSGVKCDRCFGVVHLDNYKHILTSKQVKHNNLQLELQNKYTLLSKQNETNKKIRDAVEKLTALCNTTEQKIKQLDNGLVYHHKQMALLSNNNAQSKESMIKQKIDGLKDQIAAKLDEESPYSQLISEAKKELESKSLECVDCKEKISQIEESVPYYEWWLDAYTDGIRSFIISGILPSLNDRIEYWMSVLINNKFTLKFNTQLKPTIERNPPKGDAFVYEAMSGGIKNRIDLAIAQSFADVMMISSGTTPSIVFLDEIGSDFDIKGRQQIFRMINELIQQRQVFIITHDPILLDMLHESKVITMKLENGFTTLINN